VFDPEGVLLKEEVGSGLLRDLQDNCRRAVHCLDQAIGQGAQTDAFALSL